MFVDGPLVMKFDPKLLRAGKMKACAKDANKMKSN